MSKNSLISIIIPAYNEESKIGQTLQDINDYFLKRDWNYEIIIVDDGSRDGTDIILEKYRSLNNFIVIKNEKNMGKGYSVKRGMINASGDFRLFMDADHSVRIDNLDIFMKYIESGNDIVIGSIELTNSLIKNDDNHWYRRVLGKLAKILIRLIATPKIYDTQRGFKLFTKKATEIIFPKQTINRWGFDIEILVIAQINNLKIKEVAVDWNNSRASSIHIGSYIMTFFELIKIKVNNLYRIYD